MNAGGATKAASSFFLPLERVKRAVDLLISGISGSNNIKVPRGTIQVEFTQKGFDECRRRGFPADLEKNPDMHGVLGVKVVLNVRKLGGCLT